MQAEGGKEGEDGAVLEVDVAAEDIGVLVEDAGAGVVDGDSMEEGNDAGTSLLELRTAWWTSSRSSLVAKVTSLESAATWFPVLCVSDLLLRNSAFRLPFLFSAEGLFLLTVLAAWDKSSALVSKANVKLEPMESEKVNNFFRLISARQKSMHFAAKVGSTLAIFLIYLNQEYLEERQRYMLSVVKKDTKCHWLVQLGGPHPDHVLGPLKRPLQHSWSPQKGPLWPIKSLLGAPEGPGQPRGA